MKSKIKETILKLFLFVFGWSIIPLIILLEMNDMWLFGILNPFNFVIGIMMINVIRWEDEK